MLYFSDSAKTFYVQTDASNYASGVVLYQLDKDGDMKRDMKSEPYLKRRRNSLLYY